MILLPEQERALDYTRKRGTHARLASIVKRIEETFAGIEALVEGADAERARRCPGAEGWSLHEMLDHLVASDRLAAQQLGELVAGRSSRTPIPSGVHSERPFDKAWPLLVLQFRTVHREILAILDRARDDLPLTATAPVEMVVHHTSPDGTVEPVRWVERLDWKAYSILLHNHSREHLLEGQRILTAVA